VLYSDIYAGSAEFLVTPLMMGPVCYLARFEEPVRHWWYAIKKVSLYSASQKK